MRKVVIDAETTGFSPDKGDRIIEIGAVEIINGRVTGHCFQTYLNPEGKDSHEKAIEVHGIKNEYLINKPTFFDIITDLLGFIQGDEIIAHNAGFDVMFLKAEMGKIGINFWDHVDGVIDTVQMARELFPGKKNSLDILCDRYGVNRQGRDKHGALIDSQLLAQVYLKMVNGCSPVELSYFVPDESRKGYDQTRYLIKP